MVPLFETSQKTMFENGMIGSTNVGSLVNLIFSQVLVLLPMDFIHLTPLRIWINVFVKFKARPEKCTPNLRQNHGPQSLDIFDFTFVAEMVNHGPIF